MSFRRYLDSIDTYNTHITTEVYNNSGIINLSGNENAFGVSKKVIKSIRKSSVNANFYPDMNFTRLRQALANKYDVGLNNVIIGNGSDEIISMIVRAICDKDSMILTSPITFSMYKIYANLSRAKVLHTKSNICNVDEFIDVTNTHKIDLVFVCLPNNPLGDCLDKDDIYKLLDSIPRDTFVALDCAYNEFASYKDISKYISPQDLIQNYDNVLYLGTFSKLYGLGGLRVGYGISSKSNIRYLGKLRSPYNITSISENAAIAALRDIKFINKTLKNNLSQLARYEKFASNHNIQYIDSYANFITLIFDDTVDSTRLCNFLSKKGILIRDLASYKLNAIRITVGTKYQNTKLIESIKKYLKG